MLLLALSSAQPTAAAAAPGPSIKAVFEQELVVDGRNIEQDAWRQQQGDCRQAGFPIRALTDEDARMLGVTTIELALDATRRYVRITERRLDRDSAEPRARCLVRFRTHVSVLRQDAQRTLVDDSSRPGAAVSTTTAAGAFAFTPINERKAIEASQDDGWFGPEPRSLAGARCNRWQHSRLPESICVWADGARWGWTPGAMSDACPGSRPDPFTVGIALAVEPTTGVGCRQRVIRFSSDQPLGDSDFGETPAASR